MGRIATDLTKAGLIDDGNYIGTVTKLNYQIKIGDKWNNEGTETTSFEGFAAVEDKSKKRLQYVISIPGKQNHFNDLYMGDSSAGFVQAFMKACGVHFDSDGYDPDDAVGAQVNVEVGIEDDAEFGMQNTFKYSKV